MRSNLYLGIFIFAIGVVLGLMLCREGCGGDGGGSSDTVYVKGIPDTVIVYDSTHKYVDKPTAVTKYKYVHDTIHIVGNSDIVLDPCDTVRNYTDSIEDGNCKALLNASVRGELLNWSAELFSKSTFINRVDTLKIYIPAKDRFRLGVGATLNDSLQPGGFVLVAKGRYNYLGQYNFTRKRTTIGVGINLIK